MPAEVEKAKIKRMIPPGETFDVLFNPKEIRISKSNQFSEVAMPGLSAPLLQFGHGNAQTLSLQLFFDTYDTRHAAGTVTKDSDVRTYTGKVTDLMKIHPHLHAPPVSQFSWIERRWPMKGLWPCQASGAQRKATRVPASGGTSAA